MVLLFCFKDLGKVWWSKFNDLSVLILMSVINDEQILTKRLDYINIFNFDEITVIRRNQAVSYVQDRAGQDRTGQG